MTFRPFEQLVIDVGMNTGKDTEFYLRKGFRVAAVEANPKLVESVSERLQEPIRQGRLKIYNVAISSEEGEAEFYVNRQYDGWSTLSTAVVHRNERLGTSHNIIRVPTMRFANILRETGIPYYVKIDIEGADVLCLEALHEFTTRPRYVSIETSLQSMEEAFTEFCHLWTLGYRRYKIVNQALNGRVRCPVPPREGLEVPIRFDPYMSGPFGEEAPGRWLTIDEALSRYRRLLRDQRLFGATGRFHKTLLHYLYALYRMVTFQEPVGWYDVHAALPG
jgi:FkbM family methyltransferase